MNEQVQTSTCLGIWSYREAALFCFALWVKKKEQKKTICVNGHPMRKKTTVGSPSFRSLLWENNTSLDRQMNDKPSVERKPLNICSNKHFLCSKNYFGHFGNLTNKWTKYFELPSALLYIVFMNSIRRLWQFIMSHCFYFIKKFFFYKKKIYSKTLQFARYTLQVLILVITLNYT